MGLRISEEELGKLLEQGNITVKNPKDAEILKSVMGGKGKKGFAKTTQQATEKPAKPKSRPNGVGYTKDQPQSLAEKRYYENIVRPLMLAGAVTDCNMHQSFEIIPAVACGNVKFRAKVYTPDFVLKLSDGRTKVVEIKGTAIKKLQRDYPLRRQLFILNYCVPNGWEFEEVKAETLTQRTVS